MYFIRCARSDLLCTDCKPNSRPRSIITRAGRYGTEKYSVKHSCLGHVHQMHSRAFQMAVNRKGIRGGNGSFSPVRWAKCLHEIRSKSRMPRRSSAGDTLWESTMSSILAPALWLPLQKIKDKVRGEEYIAYPTRRQVCSLVVGRGQPREDVVPKHVRMENHHIARAVPRNESRRACHRENWPLTCTQHQAGVEHSGHQCSSHRERWLRGSHPLHPCACDWEACRR